jgi:hypothetical protein
MDSSLMMNTIHEADMDAVNIQNKMFNFLKNLVDEDGKIFLMTEQEMEDDIYFYRKLVSHLIKNNKTTLRIDFNHLMYADQEFSEVIYFYFYKVNLT